MLISEAVARAKALTGHDLGNAALVRWLSEADGRIALEFYRAEAWTPYDPTDDLGCELLVPFPWDGFYPHHLEAMTYFADGEYDRYENARALAEKTLADFRAFMQRTQSRLCSGGFPTQGRTGGTGVTVVDADASRGPWFWLSAYALAVKHGYQGTEAEWVDEQAAAVTAAQAAQAAAEQARSGAQGYMADAAACASSAFSSAQSAGSAAEEALGAEEGARDAQGAAEDAMLAAAASQNAALSAKAAAESAQTAAETARSAAEGWATGGAGGTPSAGNNAAYYANQAAASAVTAGDAQSAAGTAQAAAEAAQTAAEAAQAAAQSAAASVDAAELNRRIFASFPTDSISNAAAASFSDGADGIPVKRMTVNITPAQSGSGDPAPDNVRPISGWTGANIMQTGENLMAVPMVVLTSSSAWSPTGFFLKAGTYFLAFDVSTATSWRLGIKVYDSKGNDVGNDDNYKPTCSSALSWNSSRQIWGFGANTTATTYEVSFPQDCQVAYCLWSGDVSASTTLSNVMLNVGNTEQPYAPYVGTTYPVSWQSAAGTVYGGTLTDNGDGTWTLKARPYYASYNGETLVGPWVSSMDVYAEGATPTTGAQVVDLGGAETIYTLTAESVKTLLGDNNIFADCGDIAALTYRADPTLFAAGRVAALTALMSEA